MKQSMALHRILSLLLVAVTLVSVGLPCIPVGAATVNKAEKSYDIAVAYDNSGSMYVNQAWCQAKYAMEIFASMLDYNKSTKDRLTIFPMHTVTTEGNINADGSITVQSVADIDKISNFYTSWPGGTPFTPVIQANEFLKNESTADEKWLIVLTDGEFDGYDIETLTRTLEGYANDSNINVQYLGMGTGAKPLTGNNSNFYATTAGEGQSIDIQTALVNICNRIFQRSELPSSALNGKELTLDISMSKLIVFAQGQNAKITGLKDSSGKEIKISADSGQRKFSEIRGGGSYTEAPVDDSLAGQVVTFGACPKGTYTLEYSGTEDIQIFYEPDVDINVSLKNSSGEEISLDSDSIPAGDYILSYTLVDRNFPDQDVTDSPLMGNVNLKAEIDGKNIDSGGTVNLEPGKEIFIDIEGTYLDDFRISTKDDREGFTFKIDFPDLATLSATATVEQADAKYPLSDQANWAPIRVDIAMNGSPLSDEQLAKVKFEPSISPDLKFRYESVSGESAFRIYIAQDDSGNSIDPAIDKYSFSATVTLNDDYNREMSASAEAAFEITGDLAAVATVEQSQKWYSTSSHEDWKPIRIDLTLAGKPLTDEQLANVALNCIFSEDISYRTEIIPGKSAINVYLGQDKDGNYVEPAVNGKYDMTATVTLVDQGKELSTEAKADFEVQPYAAFWRWLFFILLALLILIIILIILNQKVMPKKIAKNGGKVILHGSALQLDQNSISFDYSKKSKTIKISTTPNVGFDEACSVTLTLKPVSPLRTRSKDRYVKVVGISSPNCSAIKIGAVKYVRRDGHWMKETAAKAVGGNSSPVIDQDIHNATFELKRDSDTTLSCPTKHK